MSYSILSVDNIAGMTAISILGKGIGLKNNAVIKDDNDNEYIIKSIAMTKANIKADETLLIVEPTIRNRPTGTRLYAIT